MASDSPSSSFRSSLASTGVLILCVFLWPAMMTFDAGDWPSPNQYPNNSPPVNACGVVGAWLAYQLHYYLGGGAYPLLVFATLATFARLVRGQISHLWERVFGVALLVVCVSASVHLISGPGTASLPVGHGGTIGYALGEFLKLNLDRLGTLIVLASSLLVGLLFATEGWVLTLPATLKRIRRTSGNVKTFARGVTPAAPTTRPITPDDGVTADESEALLEARGPLPKINSRRPKRAQRDDDPAQSTLFDNKEGGGLDKDPTRCKGEEIEEFHAEAKEEAYPRQIENWPLPALSLLYQPEPGVTVQQEQIVRKQAQILERTLEEFRLDARVVEIDTGPVITMFELKLGAGIKVSQIATLSNDIARALRAHAIRVVAPISGKNTVGIEVPNVDREAVRLRELMMLAGKKASAMNLPLFLGKDAGGAPLVTDLTQMPHLLIAGTTGSGKSVCLRGIILSLLMTKRPDHVKMILVDPKMVELSQFKDVPHLMCPIVTDMVQAEKILAWAAMKMDERYELFAEAHVKNIAGYNSLGADEIRARFKPATEQEEARIATYLPYIVIIIDELADLMLTAAREVEHHLSRLAQKSRAVGVHIIVATQRPEARIVTGLIKSNLPSRICFRVASRTDSRIVLDQNGGEVLLGQGDMLFLPPGMHKLIRAQGTFLEEVEMRAVLEDLASRANPEFHPELVRLRTPGSN
ncbi:MAG: DNA translocase FtsK 4TM domain-containing protein, partial [Phycisphaerae bacterium]